MIILEIPLEPVPWTAPRFWKNHAYDPKEKDKRAIRWLIKQQYDAEPIQGYVALFFRFVFKCPESASKKRKASMLNGDILPTKGDCTNYQKLYEDCLKKILIDDDRNVEVIGSRKLYGEKGHVKITLLERDEYKHKLAYGECKL